MKTLPTIYMGWDSREPEAYDLAAATIVQNASGPVRVLPIYMRRLESMGILRRPYQRLQPGRQLVITQEGVTRRIVTKAKSGQLWDDISQAPMSTEFAIARFAVPILHQQGLAAFFDSDVLVHGDVYELFEHCQADEDRALWCVQHQHEAGPSYKMDGQAQTYYARKNWSSVMVFNCSHPANLAMNLGLLNTARGRDLHAFSWLQDQQIGKLPAEWNWLVNVTPRPQQPKIAHYTLGGPWFPNWPGAQHDDEWLAAAQDHIPGRIRHLS